MVTILRKEVNKIKRKIIYPYSLIVIVLIGIVILTAVFGNTNNPKAEVDLTNNQFLNSFNKIYIGLKKKSSNKFTFKNKDLHNGDLFILNTKKQGLDLKKGDNVKIDLTIIPDGYSATGVGYILNGQYTEVFSDSVYNHLTTSFDVEEDGEYTICIIGVNANFITIKNGVISVE